MKIGFDFDDVIYNFSGLLFNRMKNITNSKIDLRNREEFFVENLPGYSKQDVDRIVHEIMLKYWDEGEPLDSAIRGLTYIYNETGEPITMITCRPFNSMNVTNKWVEKYSENQKLFKYELIHTNKKSKAPFIQEKGFKFYVEDRPDIVKDIQHLVKYIFLIDKSWNRDCCGKNIIRVNNLVDVYQYMSVLE